MHRFADSHQSSVAFDFVKSPALERGTIPPIASGLSYLRLQATLLGMKKFITNDLFLYPKLSRFSHVLSLNGVGPYNPNEYVYDFGSVQFVPTTQGAQYTITQPQIGNAPSFQIQSTLSTVIAQDTDLVYDGTSVVRLAGNGGTATIRTVNSVLGSPVNVAPMFDAFFAASVNQHPQAPQSGRRRFKRGLFDGSGFVFTESDGVATPGSLSANGRCHAQLNVRTGDGITTSYQVIIDKQKPFYSANGTARHYWYETLRYEPAPTAIVYPIETKCEMVTVGPLSNDYLNPELLTGDGLIELFYGRASERSAGWIGATTPLHRTKTLNPPSLSVLGGESQSVPLIPSCS